MSTGSCASRSKVATEAETSKSALARRRRPSYSRAVQRATPGEIVVGYDGSGGSKAALKEACELAKELDRKLVIAFAYEVSTFGGDVQDVARAIREHGDAVTAEAAATAKEAGLEPEIVIERGDEADALARLSNERDAAMLVIGSRGESAFKRLVLGSVTHKVLHLAETPVLVVPSRDGG